jgi:TonB family protein
MIVAWMIGATVFALLLGVAALASERALAAVRGATRLPWMAALVAAVVWPLLAPMAARLMQPEAAALSSITVSESASGMLAQQLPVMPLVWGDLAGTLLLVLWAVASALLVARLFVASRVIARVQREAQHADIDGEPVLVTDAMGPAVIGLLAPRVAVPSWLLEFDEGLRAIVLRHEREHCRSRDPHLVWMAAVAVAVMPWNVGVWWMARRLRLALEIDCDARTLRDEPNADRYGKLLLLIAQRQSGNPLSTMLAESTSHLSRRITAMHMRPLRRPVLRVLLFGAVAAGAVAVACSPRLATDLTAPKTTAGPSLTKSTTAGAAYFEFQVDHPVTAVKGSPTAVYPDSLKKAGVAGKVLAQFVVDERGLAEVKTLKILKSDNDAFTQAIVAALPTMRFVSAQLNGHSVKQLVQQPFVFGVAKGSDVARSKANDGPYFEFQVMNPVTSAPGSIGPKYPEELKSTKIEGDVLAQFVVNTDGTADINTLKVLKSNDAHFEVAVKDALGSMRFIAAEVDGRKVKQLVQQRFHFAVPN